MRVKKLLVNFSLGVCCFSFIFSSFATSDNPPTSDTEKVYLIQILNQLDAMQPLILAAKQAQTPNKRVQFHYTHYQDNKGKVHAGLWEDVQAIKSGITQYLNQPAIEPRTIKPLQGDYLNLKPIQANTSALIFANTSNAAEVPDADG